MNDGLEHLLVVICTLPDQGQVGQKTWQYILVALWQAPKLTLSTVDLLLEMDPDRKTQMRAQSYKLFSCHVSPKW